MLTAEKWYRHQENYVRYGIDMSPPASLRPSLARTEQINFGIKDKARLLLLIGIIGALCIAGVISTAYASQIKYDINALARENQVIQGEIQNLDVNIEVANNIKIIEEKAISELGMVYPKYEQMVFIAAKSEKFNDFAMALREQAYN